ncbi:unnamed protein product [Protopolystoma xenopodis]|uniref:Uncharacterized protein n=1 Tax=Protopolystoma xenopodis TaxID=117903 RepID=A0A3S5ABV2_9PLAT|nr:unnamed protein product [Protopolystoma xenopodis]
MDQLFEEVDERWRYLDRLLDTAERRIRVANNSVEFLKEAEHVQRILKMEKSAAALTTSSLPIDVDSQGKYNVCRYGFIPIYSKSEEEYHPFRPKMEQGNLYLIHHVLPHVTDRAGAKQQLKNLILAAEAHLKRPVTIEGTENLDDMLVKHSVGHNYLDSTCCFYTASLGWTIGFL